MSGESQLASLYKMLVNSRLQFGRFVRPSREHVKLVDTGEVGDAGDAGDAGDVFDVGIIKDYLNERVDSILEEFHMKRETIGQYCSQFYGDPHKCPLLSLSSI